MGIEKERALAWVRAHESDSDEDAATSLVEFLHDAAIAAASECDEHKQAARAEERERLARELDEALHLFVDHHAWVAWARRVLKDLRTG